MCPAGESSRTAGHLPGVSAGFARQHVRAQTVLPRPVRTRLNLLSKRIVVPAHHASCVRTVNGRSTASPVAPRHYARLAGSRSAARAMTGQHAGHSADSSAAPSARRCWRRWQAAYQGACRGSRGGTGMETGEQPGEAMPRSPDVDAPPVVLVLVEDTTGSLASLLLAAEIAAAQQAHLHVAHVSAPRMPWGPPATLPGPAGMLIEADSAAAGELQDRVGGVLALGPCVEWTFTWTRGMVRATVTRLVSELSPIVVVVGAARRPRLSMRRSTARSTARWLIGRTDVQAVVIPTTARSAQRSFDPNER